MVPLLWQHSGNAEASQYTCYAADLHGEAAKKLCCARVQCNDADWSSWARQQILKFHLAFVVDE